MKGFTMMSFLTAAEWFHKYQVASGEVQQQPSQWKSKKNNRGWHLYNARGYLGSINKHGEHFIVKSRMKQGGE